MNILLTGAAGGIGSTLGHYLHGLGHNMFLIDNFNNGYAENLVIDGQTFGEFSQIDVRDTVSLAGLLLWKRITHVIHLAAITALPDCEMNPGECLDVNVRGTQSVLEAARTAGVKRVVVASTSAVYEANSEADAPFTETLPVNPRLFYSLSKKLAEEVCLSYIHNYGMDIVMLRYFNVFGPRQDIHRKHPPLINYVVRELVNGRQPILHSTGDQYRDYIHVDDVCRLTTEALTNEKAKGQIYNVCSGGILSVRDIVAAIQTGLDINIEPVYREAGKLWDSFPTLFEGHYPLRKYVIEAETNKFSHGSYQKAYEDLGWKPASDTYSQVSRTAQQIRDKLLSTAGAST